MVMTSDDDGMRESCRIRVPTKTNITRFVHSQLYNSLISIQQEFQTHPTIAQHGQFNPAGSYNPYAANSQVILVHPVVRFIFLHLLATLISSVFLLI